MPKINFNPNDMEQLIPYLESLTTVESVLENSALIYSSPVNIKKVELENIIRFGDLSLESLDAEHSKVAHIANTAIVNNIPVVESTQNYLVKMTNLINRKLQKMNTLDKYTDHELNLVMLENQLFDMDYTYKYPSTECYQFGQHEAVFENLCMSTTQKMLTPLSMLNLCRNYFSSPALSSDENFSHFNQSFKSQVMETLRYEMKDNNYKDLPLLEALADIRETLLDDYFDNDTAICRINQMFDEMEADMKSMIDDHFCKIKMEFMDMMGHECASPVAELNPFSSIYNMTPFPVGARTVHKTVNACLNAETDEQLIESLNQFATMMTICETFGEDILTEDAGSLVNKAKRAMTRTGKKITATVRKVGDEARRAKDTTKKITDPMVRFIENSYDTVAKADIDERKKIVMTSGFKGKLRRLIKWIKDVGILGIATGTMSSLGFTVGTVIAAIALVGYILRNASLDADARKQVLRELEDELKITREKIEDSRGDENKQNKYELMRIESKLDKEINRIKRRLAY